MASLDEHLDRIQGHLRDLTEQLEQWQGAIASFKSRAEDRKATSSGEYQLRELVLMREETDQRLEQTRSRLDDAWNDLQASVQEAWNEVKEEFQKARRERRS